MTETNEALLIQQLKKDSQQAFRRLYDKYAACLYAFGMQYTHSRESTEELVEDTFIWLWTNRRSIRQTETLKSLLFIRMRHYLVNAYRATVNAPAFESYTDYLGHLSESSSDRVEYDDFRRMFFAAFSRLPETQRRVVRLSRLEGKTNKEIALQLNLKEQTVKNQLSLGVKALRLSLGTLYVSLGFLYFVN